MSEPESAQAQASAQARPDAAQAEPREKIEAEQDRLDLLAAWDAIRVLLDAARESVTALWQLARSELHLARISWPVMLGMLVLMVGLSLSLWATAITLVAWGLYVATGSVGWALAALVGIHVILLLAARWLFKRTVHHMTLPATRAEVSGLLDRARKHTEENP